MSVQTYTGGMTVRWEIRSNDLGYESFTTLGRQSMQVQLREATFDLTLSSLTRAECEAAVRRVEEMRTGRSDGFDTAYRPEPEPEPKRKPGNRFSGLDFDGSR